MDGDSTAVGSVKGVEAERGKGETQEKKEGGGTLILYCTAMPWACLNT